MTVAISLASLMFPAVALAHDCADVGDCFSDPILLAASGAAAGAAGAAGARGGGGGRRDRPDGPHEPGPEPDEDEIQELMEETNVDRAGAKQMLRDRRERSVRAEED